MDIIKPKKLKKGDLIGIISPASAPNDFSKIDRGIKYLEGLGYKVKEGKYTRQEYGYLSGTDEERLSDIHNMFEDKEVKAIFCTRGGYGTPRLLNKINYSLIKKNPKILVGYSDLTALQLAIFKKAGLVTFSGPMVAVEMQNTIDPFTEEFFWNMLTSNKKAGKIINPDKEEFVSNKKGIATGKLLGGCLSIILSIYGTEYLPGFKNNILVFEDVDEEPYRIDRLLTQFVNGKTFKEISGLIIGAITDSDPKDASKPSLSLEQVFSDYLSNLDIPIIQNLKYGHISRKVTIPFGINVKVNAKSNSIEFLEGAVS
jgi:muramoyltetrapeptide carboxypeptidase